MFSLIVTLVAIALVVVLAAATLYYGGTSYTEQTVKADAARLVNEGLQVKAAVEFHRVKEGSVPTTIAELEAGEYLREGLSDSAWSTADGYALVTNVPEASCLAANKQLGIDHIPTCDDPGFSAMPVCCSTPEPVGP